MIKELVEEYVICPTCRVGVTFHSDTAVCDKCGMKYRYDGDLLHMDGVLTEDLKFSTDSWDVLYKKQLDEGNFHKTYDDYRINHLELTLKQIEEVKPINNSTVYMEIGCGEFVVGNEISNRAKLVIGIDLCPSALKIASKLL